MKRLILFLMVLQCGWFTVSAQEENFQPQPSSTLPADSVVEEVVGVIPESLDADIDSLLRSALEEIRLDLSYPFSVHFQPSHSETALPGIDPEA